MLLVYKCFLIFLSQKNTFKILLKLNKARIIELSMLLVYKCFLIGVEIVSTKVISHHCNSALV
jgi:hypothetical protein